MKVLITLTFEVPDVEDVAGVLTQIDPPHLRYFEGTVRVTPGPYATELEAWLDE